MNKPFHFNDNPMPKKTYKTKLSMKKIRLSHILQPNEKIYINTHNPPNKEGRTSIRAHSLAVVHEPHSSTQISSSAVTVRLHWPAILYITYSQTDEAQKTLKLLVMCFKTGKRTESYTVN